LELADVFARHGASYLATHPTTREQRRVMADIQRCRTAALGGHVSVCDQCGARSIRYNSCRDRHCPKCQCLARARWLERRTAELLPVPYFHVVFTVPAAVGDLALANPRPLYDALFSASAQTLLTIAADPRHLGAHIGFISVLHTWGQNLLHHPHVHCVVPGGGMAVDAERWRSCRPGFFLPVKVLSRLFRRLYLERLEALRGDLVLPEPLRTANGWREFRSRLEATDWVVYAKAPFGGPEQVLSYLGRYTHRVALSNDRLLRADEETVSFRWKDYRHENRVRTMTLSASELIRRFLLHILPRAFVRIRYFGLLANRDRHDKIAAARALITGAPPVTIRPTEPPSWRELLARLTGRDPDRCRVCDHGTTRPVEEVEAVVRPPPSLVA
jgi:hypothetical protein